jgi:hypothetical protein
MVSIFCPFSVYEKSLATQSAYSSLGWSWSSCSVPRKKHMLQSLKISVHPCLGWCTLRYSHDCILKTIAKVTSWAVAHWSSQLLCLLILEMTEIGIAAWCFSALSKFFNNLNSCCRVNASCPSLLTVRFGYPCSQKVTETYCTVPPTVPATNCP